jgi:hypothetical protein
LAYFWGDVVGQSLEQLVDYQNSHGNGGRLQPLLPGQTIRVHLKDDSGERRD